MTTDTDSSRGEAECPVCYGSAKNRFDEPCHWCGATGKVPALVRKVYDTREFDKECSNPAIRLGLARAAVAALSIPQSEAGERDHRRAHLDELRSRMTPGLTTTVYGDPRIPQSGGIAGSNEGQAYNATAQTEGSGLAEDDAWDLLAMVLFADPGPKMTGAIRHATERWHEHDRLTALRSRDRGI